MKYFARLLFLLLLSAVGTFATDIAITPTGPVYAFAQQPFIGSLTWGGSGPGAINNNFFFTPLNQNESVCIYVYNNNPTNAHTYNASVLVTANPSELTPADGTWQSAATLTAVNAPISPGIAGAFGASVSGSAKVALSITGGSTLAGSPDTANIVLIQTNGTCFAGNNVAVSQPNSVNAMQPIQNVSDGLSSAFTATGSNSSPAGSNIPLAVFNTTAGSKNIYFDHVVFTSAYAAQFNVIVFTSTAGCSGGSTPVNMKLNSGTASVAQAYNSTTMSCSGTQIASLIFNVPAGGTLIVPLNGFISLAGGTTGLVFSVNSGTGLVTANAYWYEK